MAEKRKADVFAGQGSLADKLRKRRMAIEEGDPSGGQETEDMRKENSPGSVLRRGYLSVKDDE